MMLWDIFLRVMFCNCDRLGDGNMYVGILFLFGLNVLLNFKYRLFMSLCNFLLMSIWFWL